MTQPNRKTGQTIQKWEVCDKSKNGQNRDPSHTLSAKEKYDTQGILWRYDTDTC